MLKLMNAQRFVFRMRRAPSDMAWAGDMITTRAAVIGRCESGTTKASAPPTPLSDMNARLASMVPPSAIPAHRIACTPSVARTRLGSSPALRCAAGPVPRSKPPPPRDATRPPADLLEQASSAPSANLPLFSLLLLLNIDPLSSGWIMGP